MRIELKKTAILLFCLIGSTFASRAQTIFWTETFNNGCASGCTANGVNTGNGAWTIDNTGGCNDALCNKWFISCAENGNAVGACGTGCGANATLHIGADDGFFLDIGAAYDAGGLGGCGNGGTYTFTRAVSPLISTIGLSGITVSFNYLEFGQGATDDGWVEYSTDGGVTWSLLVNTAKTTCCGGLCNGFRQGKWTNYTSGVLPAAANNISNLKIRFVWTNNDDGIGKDPSYAINDLILSYNTVLPIKLADFSAMFDNSNDVVDIYWATASETNNALFTIERTVDGETYVPVATVKGAGNSSETRNYSAIDPSPYEGTAYYQIKQTDFDGHSTYSYLVAINALSINKIKLFPNPAGASMNLSYYSSSPGTSGVIFIYDNAGRELVSYNTVSSYSGENTYRFDISGLASGMYFIKLEMSTGESNFGKFIKQ